MHLDWEKTVRTTCPREQVYAYLADFSRHPEWATTLERMEKVADGDATGVGARYMTHERVEFPSERAWKNWFARVTPTRTRCEVRELVPGQRIVWYAQPVPSFGGSAELCVDLQDLDGGGTLVSQRVTENYPRPVAFVMRTTMNVTEEGIRQQLDRTLDALCEKLDGLPPHHDASKASQW